MSITINLCRSFVVDHTPSSAAPDQGATKLFDIYSSVASASVRRAVIHCRTCAAVAEGGKSW
jgi:hypothetical protein